MASCEEHYPYYKEGAGFDLAIAASGGLRLGLEPIDPGAFTPGSYWSDFLSDVSNGDYGEPVDDEEDEEDW